MQIYERELLDGLERLSNITNAECRIINSSDFTGELDDKIIKSIARYAPSNPNQTDLHYLNCVLASTNWNKNYDVFDKREFVLARSTPEDKPFNVMHDESDIIGHMTGSVLVDREGNEYPEEVDIDTLPSELDIIVSAVIYKSWSDIEQLSRIRDILGEIQNGNWSVSMECLFRSFDYALITPKGEHKVVLRDESSAFLTKHLKCYGGTGEYEGHKVGRLLRDICFSAIGLVKRPANPRSVIVSNDINKLGELIMPETLAQTAAELTIETVDKSTFDELQNKYTAAEDKIKTLETSKADEIKTLQEQLDQAKSELVTAKSKFDEVTNQLKSTEDKVRTMERKSVLASMNLDEATVTSMLEKFNALDDSAFASAVALAKLMQPKPVQAETIQPEVEEVETEIELETTQASEIESPTLSDPGDTDLNKVQASLADYFSKKILKTTKNLK